MGCLLGVKDPMFIVVFYYSAIVTGLTLFIVIGYTFRVTYACVSPLPLLLKPDGDYMIEEPLI